VRREAATARPIRVAYDRKIGGGIGGLSARL